MQTKSKSADSTEPRPESVVANDGEAYIPAAEVRCRRVSDYAGGSFHVEFRRYGSDVWETVRHGTGREMLNVIGSEEPNQFRHNQVGEVAEQLREYGVPYRPRWHDYLEDREADPFWDSHPDREFPKPWTDDGLLCYRNEKTDTIHVCKVAATEWSITVQAGCHHDWVPQPPFVKASTSSQLYLHEHELVERDDICTACQRRFGEDG